jgi:hypothetical protein
VFEVVEKTEDIREILKDRNSKYSVWAQLQEKKEQKEKKVVDPEEVRKQLENVQIAEKKA